LLVDECSGAKPKSVLEYNPSLPSIFLQPSIHLLVFDILGHFILPIPDLILIWHTTQSNNTDWEESQDRCHSKSRKDSTGCRSLCDRGMHLYYLKVGTIEANPHHIVNLIHYEVLSPLYLN
ncbi:hypothetical protein Ccrd_025258, partial [Cynara cardunculus var. scolymus]